ncbi:MAG TPA: hypothetical protein VKH35_09820 [Thermoanaerobaculia bacterium]|nr:hypothetical protein [Thermoanaerobaculia bacterium]
MSRLMPLMLLAALAGCRTAPPIDIACSGPFSANSTDTKMMEVFGPANVIADNIATGEGQSEEGTVIFPLDKQRRIEVLWKDPLHRRNPKSVRLQASSVRRTYGGIGIGADLKRVEARNGKPFTLAGFGWDYAGTTASWNGGSLSKTGPCTLKLRFQPQTNGTASEEAALKATSGDREFSSAMPEMQLLDPKVYEILLQYR